MKIKQGVIGAFALLLASATHTLGQNELQFTAVSLTPENAVRLSWASNTNEVYEIDYADQLAGNDDGSTAWHPLYEDYPSHGTNTFWLDTGDYDNSTPAVLHPKNSPMRFYRVTMTGTNTADSNPTITISLPANNAVVSGNVTVTVNATSDQILTDPILYVDGQEMPPSDDGTNFVINTCEWWNGPHTLFAIIKSQSSMEGRMNDSSVTYGRAVSPYVIATFDNLILEFAFSQHFFEPDLEQTQQVTASFAVNCDWTLHIQNVNSNTVRTVTGSGTSMLFNWDGTGESGVTLPNGVYTYQLSAQANGQSSFNNSSQQSDGAAITSAEFASVASTASVDGWFPISAREALAAGLTSYYSEPPPMPPVRVRTNGVWTYVPYDDVYAPLPWTEIQIPLRVQQRLLGISTASFVTTGGSGASPADANTPTSQSTTAPVRPPNKPVKGTLGTFGIAYQSYGPSGFSCAPPRTGWVFPLPVYVKLENFPVGQTAYNPPVTEFKWVARRFSWALQEAGWKVGFVKKDDELSLFDIQKTSLGGNSLFNTVDIGILMGHGSYGSTAESDSVKYTYFFLGSAKNGAGPMRLADFDFGSSGATNGLKWMTILACHMLNPTAYNSMKNNSKLPINDDLHLLMGCTTIAYADARIGNQYGHRMAGGIFSPIESVQNAWFDAGTKAYRFYSLQGVSDTITFGVAGWPGCFNDTVLLYSDPDPGNGISETTQTVFTP